MNSSHFGNSKMRAIGIYPSSFSHTIDHLVPLCQLLDIPILCTDPYMKEVIDIFYPPMQVYVDAGEEYMLDQALKGYDTLVYTDHFRMHHGSFLFYHYYFSGPARSICALHGNSDKKRNLHWIEKFLDEDISLVYGEHMLEFMEEKGVRERLKKCITSGNFRYEYYLQHEPFFDAQVEKFLFPKNEKKTILYAPTWTAPARNNVWRVDYSGFFDLYPHVLEHIPKGFQVIVKLHPKILEYYQEEVDKIKERYQKREDIIFLEEMPLIYPLLKKVDIYLGDYSSVGYDFLCFNRPLFFITDGKRLPEQDKGVYLHSCGKSIAPDAYTKLYDIIEKYLQPDPFEVKRREIYAYAFGAKKELGLLKQELLEALS